MQAGFMRYGEEILLYRAPDQPPIASVSAPQARDAGIRPAVPLDALALDRLYGKSTPAPVARLEDYRQTDWERQGNNWRIPRSALTPILRFADVESFVQEATGGKSDGERARFLSDRRVEGRPTALHSRHLKTRPRSVRSDRLRPVGHC